ncbi:hypothetical protein M0R04_15635 [Candidatus Dojkabacteria bacterium]|jgi:hypothetical protein|nr:hypothetical protein [Candidatus Dojkabacteria bacterium]
MENKIKKILLVDVDCKYPNIALMKLSSFYKSQGYIVDFKKLHYDFFNNHKKQKRRKVINGSKYEKVFLSMIFNSNRYKTFVRGKCEVEYGGTGYNVCKKLPQEIDDCIEDYSIYNEKEYSYGFITRGCPRNCSFCFVPKKEGNIYKYREISQIVKHPKVRFYDNNILAYPKWKEVLQELIDKQIACCFAQGLDFRLLNEEMAIMLRKLNYIGEYYFAFDDINLLPLFESKIWILEKYFNKWSCRFYLYCHPSMDINNDVIKRINFLRDHKCLVYFMRDIACITDKNKLIYQSIQSWTYLRNNFRKQTWEQWQDNP